MRGGGVRSLQRRCEREVAKLGLPRPFTFGELVVAIERRRGRPMKVVERHLGTLPNMPCGIWVPLEKADVVFVEEETSPAHRQHICLHELAHILCEHQGAEVLASGYLTKLLPDLAPEKVAEVLARTSYDSKQERDAEAMATLLGRFLAPGSDGAAILTRGDDVLGELAKALHLET